MTKDAPVVLTGSPPHFTNPSNTRVRNVLLLAIAAVAAAFLLLRPSHLSPSLHVDTPAAAAWKDDIWPYRQPTPWDISTDFPHPRKLEYDVDEGTWMSVDVHPVSGEIVFDLLGDFYCLVPGESEHAHPILRGVPFDGTPRFSPSGDKLVFRSDAELGVDNIWVMPWSGCAESSLSASDEQELEDQRLLDLGVRETADRRKRRLAREGRAGAHRVTNETYRFLVDPRWHPSGDSIIATKLYSGSRSLGAGEIWQYDVPASSGATVGVGEGKRLWKRTLPPGFSEDMYNEQQVGSEQSLWSSNDTIIYSKNVIDTTGWFMYGKDVHSGIYAIYQRNLTSGQTKMLVSSVPGGASRPEISRDGKTLAFVRRVRDKEALVLIDLRSGTLTHVWYGLTYDLSTIYAPMGTYPSFAFTPTDDAIIIWAAGKLWRVPLTVNQVDEKVSGGEPVQIPFKAHISKRIAETLRPKTDIMKVETAREQRLYSFTELNTNHAGDQVVFNAAGVTYVQELSKKEGPIAVPVLQSEAAYYSPSFVPHREDVVIHARWHDTEFTTLEVGHIPTGRALEFTGLPLGRYYAPTVCECTGNRRRLAFVRFGGSEFTGTIVATAGTGLYIADIYIPDDFTEMKSLEVRNVKLVSSEIDSGPLKLRFLDGAKRLLVQRASDAFELDLTSRDDLGDYAQTSVGSARLSNEIATSKSHLAFVETQHVYLASLKSLEADKAWAKPGRATRGLARLSLDGGHDIVFSGDGKRLFWLLGPYLHSLELQKLHRCSRTIRSDDLTFGIDCVKGLLDVHKIDVTYKAANPTDEDGVLVIKNATLVTMESGKAKKDIIRKGAIVVKGGVLQSVGKENMIDIPEDATVIDAEGGIVLPGFVDVHAHWSGYFHGPFPIPARHWQHIAFLAYGVTTLHNPSFSSQYGFIERALVESGRMIAPRIYHTGGVIYGAEIPALHHEIVDKDQAREALTRIKVEGGPNSFSYKNYQLPSRAARQRLLLQARNFSMLCVPEGGMNLHWDLSYIADGMTTIEHPIPVPGLYEDILTYYAKSGTAATPTHIVNYGGGWGQELLWGSENMANNEKLRRFIPHEMLQQLQEVVSRPRDSYALFNTSASVAKLVERGGLANLGAHGQPPVGLMYHAEAAFFAAGGLSNYEVFRSASRDGALSLGLFDAIGSLSPGKLADFVVYDANNDVLSDLARSADIKYVSRGGRVWHASTMAELWPQKRKLAEMPPLNAD